MRISIAMMATEHRPTLALPEPLTGTQEISYLPEIDSLLRGANLVALQVRNPTACTARLVAILRSNSSVLVQGSLARGDLWYEVALLKKLLYKAKNQHHGSKHFQRLTEV